MSKSIGNIVNCRHECLKPLVAVSSASTGLSILLLSSYFPVLALTMKLVSSSCVFKYSETWLLRSPRDQWI